MITTPGRTLVASETACSTSAALVLHAVSFIPVTLIGFVLMFREGFSLGGLERLAKTPTEKEIPVAP